MMGDAPLDEHLHIRISEEDKQLIRRAAAFDDKDMAEWVRDTLRRNARDDLPVEVQPAD